jgi:hypothetical protein
MVELALAGATMNRGCVLRTHLCHDRMMRLRQSGSKRARHSAHTASHCRTPESPQRPPSTGFHPSKSIEDAVCASVGRAEFFLLNTPRFPDKSMVGPFATAHNADEFFQVAEGLLKIVRGHKVSRSIAHGNDIAAPYEITREGQTGPGSLTIGGWFTTAGERVFSGQLIYDSAAFDVIVSPF